MLYKNKSNWNTLDRKDQETKAIANLLGVDEAKILRIGNDTTDEEEISHMDWILLRSKFLKVETNTSNPDFILCQFDGEKFVRAMIEDVVEYFIVNDEGTPANLLNITEVEFVDIIDEANGKKQIDVDFFKSILPGSVFSQGEIENSPEGLYMTNSNIGKKLLWIAKKGEANDWTIYTHWADKGFMYVMSQGDKVIGEANIRKLVRCTDEVFKQYRM